MESTDPPPVRTIVVPPGDPCEPAPRSTTPLFRLIVAETVYLPAASCTTCPAGHASIADWMSPPSATVAQFFVRCGRPLAPSGIPSGPSERMPGFQVVTRLASTSCPGPGGPESMFGLPPPPPPPPPPLLPPPPPSEPGVPESLPLAWPPELLPQAPAWNTSPASRHPIAPYRQRSCRDSMTFSFGSARTSPFTPRVYP